MNEFRIRIRRLFKQDWILVTGVISLFLSSCEKKHSAEYNYLEGRLDNLESRINFRLNSIENGLARQKHIITAEECDVLKHTIKNSFEDLKPRQKKINGINQSA